MATQFPFGSGRDYLDRRGAAALARMIEEYWRARGFSDVAVRTEYGGVAGRQAHGPVFAVRSNLDGRGLPPSARMADLARVRGRGLLP